MGIAENLKRLRAREKLSQTELAEKAHVSQQLISQLEREINVTTKKLPDIARALNSSMQELDPNFADGAEVDADRQRLIKIYDSLPPELRPVAVVQVAALKSLTPQSPSSNPRGKAGERRE